VCPRDVSVAGFDDTRYASVSYPRPITIHQPMVEMGRAMVGVLLDILSGKVESARSVALGHRLVLRESTQAIALVP